MGKQPRGASQPKKTVAVIGSGMAGLVSAYLIQQDSRYEVEVFESQDGLSLDSASYTLTPDRDDPYRIDLPMRAFDENFHINLRRMYDYLNIEYKSPKFIYPVSTLSATDGKKTTPHFIHSSSSHRIPPVRPEGCGFAKWILQTAFLAVCYLWFTACCFFIKPKPATSSNEDESLQQYLERIRLPRYFSRHYLLPLMSSITTCSHDALLNFPAIDCVEYAQRTFRQPHYTVVGGVQKVQTKISKGQAIKFGATVTAVENTGTRVRVFWTQSGSGEKADHSSTFDHVVMAVTPNVVSAIYEPLQNVMRSMPIAFGEAVVHRDLSTIPDCGKALQSVKARQQQQQPDQPEIMYICSNSTATESIHEHPSSILVTNFPITPIDPAKVIHRAQFTRVLRTPKSRQVVQRIFGPERSESEPGNQQEKGQLWRNGDGNVWLVGAWCWDGMVLLEGCVVSAMRVAMDLGVEVPWLRDD